MFHYSLISRKNKELTHVFAIPHPSNLFYPLLTNQLTRTRECFQEKFKMINRYRPKGLKQHFYPPGACDLRTSKLALSSIEPKEIKRPPALEAVCPKGQLTGSALSAPAVQKDTLSIGVFRRHIMKKKGLKLGLEERGRQGKITCFSTKGAGDFYCYNPSGTQQP